MIPHAVLDSRLNPHTLTVYAFLAKHSRADLHGVRTCYPSLKTLSVQSGMALSTVRKSVRVLQSKGFLTIRERFAHDDDRRGHDSHFFTLTLPKADCAEAQPGETVDPPPSDGGASPARDRTLPRQTVEPPPSDTPEQEVFKSIQRGERGRVDTRPPFETDKDGARLDELCQRLYESAGRLQTRPSPFSGKNRRDLLLLLGLYSDDELVRAYLEHLEPLDDWQMRNANTSFVDGGAVTLIRARRAALLKRQQEAQGRAEAAERLQSEGEAELTRLRAANEQEAAEVEEVLGA
jgi:hypothetical protein